MSDAEFVLHLRHPGGQPFKLFYTPATSHIRHEDGELMDLGRVGYGYSTSMQSHRTAFAVSADNPRGKMRSAKTLKIMLGKACNYSCSYCSQAVHRHSDAGKLEDVEHFLANLPSWLTGSPHRIEIWGGEPLVYWKKLLRLVPELRRMFPDTDLFMFTNGSLLDDEKIEWLDEMGFTICISHDGPAQDVRGPDPFDNPDQAEAIRKLYWRLKPKGRIGMAFVVNARNYDFGAVRAFFAEKLNDPDPAVTTSEFMAAYDPAGLMLSPSTEAEHATIRAKLYDAFTSVDGLPMSSVNGKISGFFSSLATGLPAAALGQKCSMDLPGQLAVDLKGDVATCQNVSADGRHHLGNVADFDNIKLTSATHWSLREECTRCPVLQVCAGGCMFLEGVYWERSCDNAFTYNMAILAAALYFLTGAKLEKIEGLAVRRDGITEVVF